jgi:hypothetical protein
MPVVGGYGGAARTTIPLNVAPQPVFTLPASPRSDPPPPKEIKKVLSLTSSLAHAIYARVRFTHTWRFMAVIWLERLQEKIGKDTFAFLEVHVFECTGIQLPKKGPHSPSHTRRALLCDAHCLATSLRDARAFGVV